MLENTTKDRFFRRTWIIRLCSKLEKPDIDLPWRERKNLLGFSSPFKLPGRNISFTILKTGIADHAVMSCVAPSMTELLKRITEKLAGLAGAGKSYDEMLEDISELDLDEYHEFTIDNLDIH